MDDKLIAFWHYDLFPYLLSGEVSGFTGKGLVYIEKYQGTFKPLIVLPIKEGTTLQNEIDTLTKEYYSALSQLKTEYSDKLKKIAPFLGENK